jgi:hypothetical protein
MNSSIYAVMSSLTSSSLLSEYSLSIDLLVEPNPFVFLSDSLNSSLLDTSLYTIFGFGANTI